jgi:hypothetical protein
MLSMQQLAISKCSNVIEIRSFDTWTKHPQNTLAMAPTLPEVTAITVSVLMLVQAITFKLFILEITSVLVSIWQSKHSMFSQSIFEYTLKDSSIRVLLHSFAVEDNLFGH